MSHRMIGAIALGAALGLAPAAYAASTRTHVSNAGSDANTAFSCDYAHPCRTFAAALTETTPGGEILAIDSSGYGKVTIDRSVSIIAAPGVFAGIGVGSGTGITISAPGADVVLRGLTLTGQGGYHGISMLDGVRLSVENCVLRNFTLGSAIAIQATARVQILDTLVQNGYNGVFLMPGSNANIVGVRILGNANHGLYVGTGATATLGNSLLSGNTTGIVSYGTLNSLGNNAATGNTGPSIAAPIPVAPF